ncbi:uncharacterized protein LOC113147375 [Cyclospora cayetanensis]|uniref:Uncharacterized protein LOC113147375 n=1 Tax=Cyclospora cayetanensis TaxID=88456 RepID=A0A6P6RZX1_9EIME|nr:uncharacterized protein LOC113147375 [Cyclospora cayetanensis]
MSALNQTKSCHNPVIQGIPCLESLSDDDLGIQEAVGSLPGTPLNNGQSSKREATPSLPPAALLPKRRPRKGSRTAAKSAVVADDDENKAEKAAATAPAARAAVAAARQAQGDCSNTFDEDVPLDAFFLLSPAARPNGLSAKRRLEINKKKRQLRKEAETLAKQVEVLKAEELKEREEVKHQQWKAVLLQQLQQQDAAAAAAAEIPAEDEWGDFNELL